MESLFKIALMLGMLAIFVIAAPPKISIAGNALMQELCDKLTISQCFFKNGYQHLYSVYDPVAGRCKCSYLPSEYLIASRCANLKCPTIKSEIHYAYDTGDCFCTQKNAFNGPINTYVMEEEIASIDSSLPSRTKKVAALLEKAKLLADSTIKFSSQSDFDHLRLAAREVLDEITAVAIEVSRDVQRKTAWIEDQPMKVKRQADPSATTLAPDVVPTYIPPPKADVTPELINQSLIVQPQNTATIGSVIPQLNEGKIMYLVQFAGPVAQTIVMNSSISFPCGLVGSDPQPNIKVVPKYVQQGSPQTTVSNCICFALNMYNKDVITYWIRHENGAVYSLVGSNKVSDVDQINTSAPIALSMIAVPSNQAKRGSGIIEPSMSTAIMSEEACDSITCINNGDKPAMFNPFTRTCFCAQPAYVEDNPSAWAGGQ